MAPTVFINTGGKLIRQHSSLDELSGWWNCIKSVDINGDGYEDLLLGNLGLNSKLQASASYPLKMYIGDFDNNGIMDQLLAVQKNGRYYPFLGKEDLEKQLPYLRKQFPQYAEMAGKTMEEIFGDKLNSAHLFQAKTMESMVLLNDRHGGFISTPLPMPMQWSSVFSFAADDFDRDGKKDILAGGNFYGVHPFEGRYDAMPPTFGKGDGRGNFDCPVPYPPALLIPGEIRDIKRIRIGKQKCLILARNNDSLIFLRF